MLARSRCAAYQDLLSLLKGGIRSVQVRASSAMKLGACRTLLARARWTSSTSVFESIRFLARLFEFDGENAARERSGFLNNSPAVYRFGSLPVRFGTNLWRAAMAAATVAM